MPSRYETFDRTKLSILPLSQRTSDMTVADILPLGARPVPFDHPAMPAIAQAVKDAHARGSSVVLMMGAHVIKQGLSRYVIDLVRRGLVSVVAMNGACAVHDYELARSGASTESVAKYISSGQFGLWRETAELNDVVRAAADEGLGFGEALGRCIAGGCPAGSSCPSHSFPHKDTSIFATAYEAGIPATVHVGIGYDIVHEHANCDGAAVGAASYRDFLIYTRVLEKLEGGVVLCFGTAVMGPEVFLKALAMVRNVARGQGREVRRFTTAVFDLVGLSSDLNVEAGKDSPEYYYRPFKTLLVRTVRDGGRSFYIRGDHRGTIPALHGLLTT